MRFGSYEMFHSIEENIKDEENFQWYNEMFSCIECDARAILRMDHIAESDVEDIIQDVQVAVARNLIAYVDESRDKNEQQRNAWLKTIIKNKEMDFFRKSTRVYHESLDALELDVADTYNTTEKAMIRMELFEAFNRLSEINSTPDRLLAFLLNKLSSITNESNGGPRLLEDELKGKTLTEVYSKMKEQMCLLFDGDISDDVLKPLWKKVEPYGEVKFELNARKITDSSSWITGKMRESRGDIQ